MIELALVPLCAVCDRLRGGWSIAPRAVHKVGGVIYGLLLGYLVGLPYHLIPVFAGLWWLGEKPGWGYPMGQALFGKVQHAWAHPDAKPEKWQIGPLKQRPWVSLAVRGALWGAPTLVLTYWHPWTVMALGMALAMPVGVLAEKHLTPRLKASGEAWRGLIMGLIAWVPSVFLAT